jgi:tetratricopeptide (TPR) repeat protein
VAADRVALGAILDGQGRYAESEPLYRAALRVLRRSPEAGAHDLAVALHDLGSMYVLRGRVERGRRLLEEAAAIKRRVLGAGHPSLEVTLHNLEVAARRRETRDRGS